MANTKNIFDFLAQYPKDIPEGVEIYLLKDQPVYNRYKNSDGDKSFFQEGFLIRFSKDYITTEYWKDTDLGDLLGTALQGLVNPFSVTNYIKAWFCQFITGAVGYPFPNPDFDYFKCFTDREENGDLILHFLPNYFGTRNFGYDPSAYYKFFERGNYNDVLGFFDDESVKEKFGANNALALLQKLDAAFQTFEFAKPGIMHEVLNTYHESTMNTIVQQLKARRAMLYNSNGNVSYSLGSVNDSYYSDSDTKYEVAPKNGVAGNFYVFHKPSGAPIGGFANAGHLGWGFDFTDEAGETVFYGGSTEQFTGAAISNALDVSDQQVWSEEKNPIGAWIKKFDTKPDLLHCFAKKSDAAALKQLHDAPTQMNKPYSDIMGDYTAVYSIEVGNIEPELAIKTGELIRTLFPYKVLSSNCMDHTLLMMKVYGLNPAYIPSLITCITPNKWIKTIEENFSNDYKMESLVVPK